MPCKLTWDDLVIEKISAPEAHIWLSYWSDAIGGKIAPIFMSKFGDWFLRRPDGSTDEFSVIEGTNSTIALSPDEFIGLVNTPSWQEEHLLSIQVSQLHERGIIPKHGQCYGFAPHPLLTGRIEIGEVMLMDIGVWQSICAQLILSLSGPKK